MCNLNTCEMNDLVSNKLLQSRCSFRVIVLVIVVLVTNKNSCYICDPNVLTAAMPS